MELDVAFAAKLERFLLMAKSAKGAAAAKLIQDATSAPGIFVFAELLEHPNIHELANHEQHAPYFSLLQLFSYKTYQDYLQHKDRLPALNQAQITKLKHLSLVSLASERHILPYSDLLQALDMPNIRQLEDLIIDAVYLDVLRGKLDQKEQYFQVEYTMGRDLEPGKIDSILAALQEWSSTTASVLSILDQKLIELSKRTADSKATDEEYEKSVLATLREVTEKAKDSRGQHKGIRMGGGGHAAQERPSEREFALGDSMDVDEPADVGRSKSRRAPTDAGKGRKRNRF